MTNQTQPLRTEHDRRIHEVVLDNIVPGFVAAFPSSVHETVGVLADLRDRLDPSGMGCIAGAGRD